MEARRACNTKRPRNPENDSETQRAQAFRAFWKSRSGVHRQRLPLRRVPSGYAGTQAEVHHIREKRGLTIPHRLAAPMDWRAGESPKTSRQNLLLSLPMETLVRAMAWGRSWGPPLVTTSALLLSAIFVVPAKLTGGCGLRIDLPTYLAVLALAGSGLAWQFRSRKRHALRVKAYWAVMAGILSLVFLVMPPIPLLEVYSTC